MTFDGIFTTLDRLAQRNSDRFTGTADTAVNLHITGGESGIIGIVLSGGKLTLQKQSCSSPDAVVAVSGSDLLAILDGRLKPMAAVMTGRLRVSGNAAKLMQIVGSLT